MALRGLCDRLDVQTTRRLALGFCQNKLDTFRELDCRQTRRYTSSVRPHTQVSLHRYANLRPTRLWEKEWARFIQNR